MIEFSLFGAFLVGLLGGVHCVGMCGGIVAALSFSPQIPPRPPGLPLLLAYNAGRILSYTLAGALLGGIAAFAEHLADIHQWQRVLQVIAALFMISLGLYLGGWWQGITRIEGIGAPLWRRIEPVGRRWLPARAPAQAFALGIVWGWLPCGLVYSVLIWSLTAGSAQAGAALMLSFGLGTLPNLLAMGLVAAKLSAWTRLAAVRGSAGALVIVLGLFGLWRAWQGAL